MKTHYRRISKTSLGRIKDLAEFGAVAIGKDGKGWTVLHVVGEDRDDLPGKYISAATIRRWEFTDPKEGINPHRFI